MIAVGGLVHHACEAGDHQRRTEDEHGAQQRLAEGP
jgi:hypothetical protein